MTRNSFLFFLIFFCVQCSSPELNETKPNIIFILADDLGYGELGVYGQEIIKTPNIDALANRGMRFTQHYSGAPVCAPARCVFLTGQHTGHAFIRGNDEWTERGDVWNYEKACLEPAFEGQFPIPADTKTLGKELKAAGYVTGIFGKWGLGAPESEGIPGLQGFDQFYGYNCQRQAHNLYPPHLWDNIDKSILDNEMVIPHVKLDSLADPNDEASYAKFRQKDYAPARIHEEAIKFLNKHHEGPFFMYYASPLPHLPLQAPREDVEAYREIIGNEQPFLGETSYFPCQYPRATYAAMITHLDRQVGEIVSELQTLGIADNTIIIFSSDNGPTYTGGVDFEFFESSKPFTNGYGRTKGFVYEGGIRVPLIAYWPGMIAAGTESDHISAFYDLMPTICDLAQIEPPVGIDGISFKPELLGQTQTAHDFLYWEFPSYNGQQAVRFGKWKGIRKDIFDGNLDIELYNLEEDILEQKDVSGDYSNIVNQIEQIMIDEHEPSVNENFRIAQLGDSLRVE